MKWKIAGFSLGLGLVLAPIWGKSEQVVHAGTTYYIYRLDPKKEKLELFLGEPVGKANTFPNLQDRLKEQGKELKFATNGGIYEPSYLPTGLHISEGKTVVPINLDNFEKTKASEFTPNFYLKPNGVFYLLEDGKAGILESQRFSKSQFSSKVRVANQSGPLLLYGGKIHPIFTKDSTSRRFRNGVGITRDGKVIFACSIREPEKGISNLFHFASLFKDKLGCPHALYLDGDISYVYIKGVTPPIKPSNVFAGIFAITQPKP